jgi:HK97 family phage prohead protease/HK97 family phage major capsid protein
MPMKPHKGESQSDFMGRCVPEMLDADSSRTNDQAVAICASIWRDKDKEAHMATSKTAALRKVNKDSVDDIEPDDCPDPQSEETYTEYVDRCTESMLDEFSDLGLTTADAQELCENRADSEDLPEEDAYKPKLPKAVAGVTNFKIKTGEVLGEEFCLSDESVDRMGDVIEQSGWQLDNFNKNPVALFNHNANFPIGKWHNLHVKGKQLKGHLELAPEGTSERIDEIRRLVKAGILKAVSVGFKPLQYEAIDKDDPWGGQKFISQELVETSLVSVPANPNALAVARSLNVSRATLDLVFRQARQPEHRTERKRVSKTGEHAVTHRNNRRGAMSLAQRIEDAQGRISGLREKLEKHLESIDDSNVSDTQLEITTELNQKIAQEEKGLTALRDAERHLAADTGNNGNGNGNGRLPAVKDTNTNVRRPFSMERKKVNPLEYVVRAGAVQLFAHRLKKNPEEVRQALSREYGYYDDEPTKAFLDYSLKAATNPAMTTVVGWAAELVQQINADMMETLMPKSVYPRMAGLGLSLSFGRAGRIAIPTRSRTPTIAGSFVGEGQPIPVRQGAFTAQILTPKKMAVITTWTREIDEHSIPAVEGLLRNAIQEDTAVSLDSVLLDANAATVVRPAGILNGVASLTPTAGGGLTALIGDLKQLSGALMTSTQGHVRNMAWLMNPQQVLSASLTSAPGTGIFPFKDEIGQGRLLTYPIIDSGTIPMGTVIVVDAADFVSVGGEAPRFEISDQATLHEEDTTPLPINAGTPATPIRSLWQTDSMALRLILPINWTLRRAGVVAWVQGVTW